MSAKQTLTVLLLCGLTCSLHAQINCLAKADVVLILDESQSVGPANFELMKNFSISIIKSFGASISAEWMQVSLMTFGVFPRDIFYLNATYDLAVLISNISSLIINNGTTRTERAFFNVYDKHFLEKNGRRSTVPAVVLLLTDGRSDNPSLTSSNADTLKNIHNATIFAIGIQNASISELNDVSSDPDSKYAHFVNTFSDLASITDLIVNETCDSIPESALVPGVIPPGTNLTQVLQGLITAAGATTAASSSGTGITAAGATTATSSSGTGITAAGATTAASSSGTGNSNSRSSSAVALGLGIGIPSALVVIGVAIALSVCCCKGLIGPLRRKKEKKKEKEDINTSAVGEMAVEAQQS